MKGDIDIAITAVVKVHHSKNLQDYNNRATATGNSFTPPHLELANYIHNHPTANIHE